MDYNIENFLVALRIEKINPGLCTGTKWHETSGDFLASVSPADGREIAAIRLATVNDYNSVMEKAGAAFMEWRKKPAPARGEIVRQIGMELRKYKEPLGRLVSYEMGKIYQEGQGEVQEMIDICDFAVGQSRQLYGFTMHSERPGHRLYDQYHPLGIVGIVSAFNFPVAVWAWNTMIALVAGDVVVWKPSSKALLCAIAVHKIIAGVFQKNNIPEGVVNLVATSSKYLGDEMFSDRRIPLISFTGSTRIGRKVGRLVGERLGKSILELGGNNAIIITPQANMEMALRAVTFGAVGTCGQRCTSTRRIILHESLFEEFSEKLVAVYKNLKIGHPLNPVNHVGPLVDIRAKETYLNAVGKLTDEGGRILYGGKEMNGEGCESDCYVIPAIAEAKNHFRIVQEETFAPLLYLIKYRALDEALALHNAVPQGFHQLCLQAI